MKLECIEDVIMNVSNEKAFTKGKIYNGYYYQGKLSIEPYRKMLCAKNDFGQRHGIKNPDSSGLDEFFGKHFRELQGEEA